MSNQSTNQQINQSTDPGETIRGAIYGGLVGLALAAAGMIIGAGAFGVAGQTTSFWYLSRSAGFVAYLLLWGSVAWGLLLSTKIGRGKLKAPVLLDAHQFLSAVGLGFTFFHGLVLMGDQYLSFPLSAVLVPFAGTYEPLLGGRRADRPVALGLADRQLLRAQVDQPAGVAGLSLHGLCRLLDRPGPCVFLGHGRRSTLGAGPVCGHRRIGSLPDLLSHPHRGQGRAPVPD